MMPSTSDKTHILSLLDYVLKQGEFILETTSHMTSYNDFMMTINQVILFNSTCMCLQTIGESLRTVDNITNREWLRHDYPEMPWNGIFGLRNIISHEYASTDPEEIFIIVREDLNPLLDCVRKIKADIENES